MKPLIGSLLERRDRQRYKARMLRQAQQSQQLRQTKAVSEDVTKKEEHSMEMRDNVVETTQNVSADNEDYLLTQIDAFRVKAQQLQQLLQTKEAKAQELQKLVAEREDKAQELQELVTERQDRADGFSRIMEDKIDGLVEQVNVKLEEVKASVNVELEQNRKQNEELFTQMQEQFREDLTSVKSDLSEKIHTENVQSYRNVSELVRNVEHRLDKLELLDKKIGKLRGLSIGIVIFAILNLAGVAVSILLNLGILG